MLEMALIRLPGAQSGMSPEDVAKFVGLYEGGRLVKPEDSGQVIASLAIRAPSSMSGQFVAWDASELQEYRS